MTFLIIYIAAVLIYVYLRKKGRIKNRIGNYLYDYQLLIKILIAWILIGFFFNLDYSDRWGCIITSQPIFGKLNIIFSSVSIIITIAARLLRNNSLKILLHVTELLFWIGKLIIYKGGYAVGFGGVPDLNIVLYDYVALLIRITIISNISFKIKIIYSSIITLIIILIKIYIFPTQQTVSWEFEKSLMRSDMTLLNMQGNWLGSKTYKKTILNKIVPKPNDSLKNEYSLIELIELDSNGYKVVEEEIMQADSIEMSIDSNIVTIFSNGKYDKFLIHFRSESSASLFEILSDSMESDKEFMKYINTEIHVNPNWSTELNIRKINNDSMIFETGFIIYENKYELKKVTPANTGSAPDSL